MISLSGHPFSFISFVIEQVPLLMYGSNVARLAVPAKCRMTCFRRLNSGHVGSDMLDAKHLLAYCMSIQPCDESLCLLCLFDTELRTHIFLLCGFALQVTQATQFNNFLDVFLVWLYDHAVLCKHVLSSSPPRCLNETQGSGDGPSSTTPEDLLQLWHQTLCPRPFSC